ncbi:MAG: MATE family efflux transporter, partial [Sphingopyxis sp.]
MSAVSANVQALPVGMLVLGAPFILFGAVQIAFVVALRSLGDQVMSGAINIFAFFIVTGAGGWWLVRAGFGTDGLVIASGAGMVVAALLNGARFARISQAARWPAA